MLESEHVILPLVLLFIILVIILLAISINKLNESNKEFLNSVTVSIDQYKKELQDENAVFVKQVMEQVDQGLQSSDKKSEKELFNIFLKLRGAIKENCDITMNKVGAARLAVYLLHNGTYSTHGISFFKMSCICEKVAVGSGVRERMIEHTNIPINLLDSMIDTLIENNRYIVMNDNTLDNSNHKIFVSSSKINYTQLIAIYDINNNMLGFVAAEMDKTYSKDSADVEREYLSELAKQLTPVLSYSDYITMKATSM